MTSFKRGNWSDEPCYYVCVKNGAKVAYLAGPFQSLEKAESRYEEAVNLAHNHPDPWAWAYEYATCKAPNGYRDGLFNKQMGI